MGVSTFSASPTSRAKPALAGRSTSLTLPRASSRSRPWDRKKSAYGSRSLGTAKAPATMPRGPSGSAAATTHLAGRRSPAGCGGLLRSCLNTSGGIEMAGANSARRLRTPLANCAKGTAPGRRGRIATCRPPPWRRSGLAATGTCSSRRSPPTCACDGRPRRAPRPRLLRDPTRAAFEDGVTGRPLRVIGRAIAITELLLDSREPLTARPPSPSADQLPAHVR